MTKQVKVRAEITIVPNYNYSTPTSVIRYCKVIHGDLAARNVLVFNSNVVKIADFGMSKQLYGAGQYTMKKQVKLLT